jgi:multidrug efflux pump subunit AcrB
VLAARWFAFALFIGALAAAAPTFNASKQIFLPEIDEGQVSLTIVADPGINLEAMDALTSRLEQIVSAQPEVETVFTSVGGFVFGRSQYESSNRARLNIALKPLRLRKVSSDAWIERVRGLIHAESLAGAKVRLYTRGIRGVHIGRGDDDISLRVQGPDLDVLEKLADQIVDRLEFIEGLENLRHSSEALTQEISVQVDRERASSFGITVEDVGMALRVALDGISSTEFIDADRSFDVRLRLDRRGLTSLKDLEAIILFSETEPRARIRIGEIARVQLVPSPATILRDKQRRIVEVSASVSASLPLGEALERVNDRLAELVLPEGYILYDGGSGRALQEGRDLSMVLLGLALFLVFVVMAVQYESLRNPLVIMLSVPFALIGVAIGIELTELPLSMPVWLGLIMLAGIVVNNAIVLVEYIELKRSDGLDRNRAIVEAATLRLRPILMTTLTTVVGMLPLALALGEGAEMLQPLAVSIVAGLSFAMVVSLVLVPAIYQVLGRPEAAATSEAPSITIPRHP